MKKLIDVARGKLKADLVLKGARIANVFISAVDYADIAISDGIIAGIGSYSGEIEVDCSNLYVIPGLIDGHIHIESSMLTPYRFSEAIIRQGVTTVIADPHEIANVAGEEGIRFMINSAENALLDCKFMLPSSVPATPFETAGAEINGEDTARLIVDKDILGLGEMMNYPAVINSDEEALYKLEATIRAGKVIDGHAPYVSGNELNAYIVTGISTDHEATAEEEALEKISRGMYILAREGTAAKNLKALINLAKTDAYRRMLLSSDDCHPNDILNQGSIIDSLRMAVAQGIDPLRAIAMATLNAAECYGLKDRGAIAPGRIADLVLVDDLKAFNIHSVYKSGKLVPLDGASGLNDTAKPLINSINCIKPIKKDIAMEDKGKAYVIGLIPDSVLTEKLYIDITNKDDILKAVLVERHKATGNIAKAYVKGYGLKNGAVASTIAHDSHNIIAIGDNDEDILLAIDEIINVGGGLTITSKGKVLGTLRLNIGGLMSDSKAEDVNTINEELVQTARAMGVKDGIHPFMTLSFIALPVIPSLKLTDKGLFDVDEFKHI